MWLKKKDKVLVLAGKDKGKRGEILSRAGDGLFVVSKINMVKRHQKPRQNEQGGIIEKEAGINASNVMVVCGSCGKHTRIAHNTAKDGSRSRACRRCGTGLDK